MALDRPSCFWTIRALVPRKPYPALLDLLWRNAMAALTDQRAAADPTSWLQIRPIQSDLSLATLSASNTERFYGVSQSSVTSSLQFLKRMAIHWVQGYFGSFVFGRAIGGSPSRWGFKSTSTQSAYHTPRRRVRGTRNWRRWSSHGSESWSLRQSAWLSVIIQQHTVYWYR